MNSKSLPFNLQQIKELTKTHSTPFHVYDEKAILSNGSSFHSAFSWVPKTDGASGGFRNYFAVKALPNPEVLKSLKTIGMGFDCSSLVELLLMERIGVRGEDIMFSSNDTKAEEYVKARELGAIINLDDISHIDYLEKSAGLPELLCFRFNPGPERSGNEIIGNPSDAKYGLTRAQILEAYPKAKSLGVKRFGLHTMVASNELNPDYFIETAKMLFELALEIHSKTGIRVEFLNLGGGIGIPYKPEDEPVDLVYVSNGIQKLYDQNIKGTALDPLKLIMECGRVVSGPYGYLVSTVLHEKKTYKDYIGLDSSMANLMRPAMYGAYHHVTVLGKEKSDAVETYDLTGSLCENNDKFAIDRKLPKIDIGDIVVIHDTGAHGHSMGFNYNGKLRSAEFMLKQDGTFSLIRRAETYEDHFATLNI